MKSHLLKAERIRRGWTQITVAEAVGVDSRTVGRWERGATVPYPYFREQLCLLFEKTPEQLGLLSDDESNLLEDATSFGIRSSAPALAVPASFLADPSIPQSLKSATSLVGRDGVLMQVKERLLAGDNVALRAEDGLPGIGKTALAAVLTMDQQVREHFCDGILWAGLGPRPNVLEHLARWGMLLGVVPSQVDNINSREAWDQALRAVIGTRRRLLLILDDVWTAEHALSLQVGGMACAHVVTTRFSEVARAFGQKASITVTELEEMERIALLSRFVPELIEQDPQGTHALVQAVGGLPLALTLMGSYLASQTFPAQSHPLQIALALLHDTKERLRVRMPKVPEEGSASLEETMPLSLHAVIAICDQQLSPQAHAALCALAVFLPKPESFSQEVALAVTQLPVETLDALCDAGLLEVSGPGRYLLHQAVADSIIRTQGKVSVTQKQWMEEIDDSWLTDLFGEQERNGLSATGSASLTRKEEVDRRLGRVPLESSVDEQGESGTGRITSSSARSTDAPTPWTVRALRGKRRLLRLVLLLSMVLALIIYTLWPVVITKLDASSSPTISTRDDPYSPFSGKLALNDPLSDSSRSYDWQTTAPAKSNDGWSCQFIGGAYHAVELLNAYDSCHAASQVSNFTFEIHMQILQGSCGGIVLRDTISQSHAYSFKVCQNGSYQFVRHSNGGNPVQILTSGYSSAITTGLNQSNVIATVANGGTFDLYVNHHKIASINNSSYSQGQFGVCADANTEVAYTNAKMWTL
jgi:transcriptional regulator with XRE-family HTH domain